MATITYSGTYSDRIQCVLDYSTANTSDTVTTLTLKANLQAKSYYLSGYSVSASIDGSSASNSAYVPTLNTSFTTFVTATKTKTYTRTHSSQNVSVVIASSYAGASAGGYNAGPASGSYSQTVTITIPAKTSYNVTYNANGGSLSTTSQKKWYGENLTLLTSSVATRTGYTISKWNTKADGSGTNYALGGTYSANAAVTLYAIWVANTYSISYNANGGSNAPGSQTKTYGVALTLSSSKPTRTGYSFVKWNTASNGSGTSYSSGAQYTANASVILYAQWKANTYTITYNANGGSNAPAAGTKTYNVAYTISASKPSRPGYNFSSWNTKANGSGTSYASAASYTANANVTLYAQWTIAHAMPTIKGYSGTGIPTVLRCDSNGTANDIGTYAHIAFGWTVSVNTGNTAYYTVSYKLTTASTYTSLGNTTVSGTSGAVSATVGSGAFSTDYSYNVKIAVVDSSGYKSEFITTLTAAFFTLDFKAGGKGIGVGQAAPDPTGHANGLMQIAMDLLDVGGNYVDAIRHPVLIANGSDLNDYDASGIYYQGTSANTSNMSNIPENLAFWMTVEKTGPAGWTTQRILFPTNGHEYVRYYSSWSTPAAWTDWVMMGGVDCIIEQGTSGVWRYRKWQSGVAECWGTSNVNAPTKNLRAAGTNGAPLFYSDLSYITLPSIFTSVTSVDASISTTDTTYHLAYVVLIHPFSTTQIGYRIVNLTQTETSYARNLYAHVFGMWK